MLNIYRPRGGGGFALSLGKMKFLFLRSYGISTCGIFIGSHFLDLNAPIYFAGRLLERCRRPFPYFGVAGLRCCDHGGRVMSSYPFWAWNYWTLQKHLDYADQASDGPAVISFLNFPEWVACLQEYRKHGGRWDQ